MNHNQSDETNLERQQELHRRTQNDEANFERQQELHRRTQNDETNLERQQELNRSEEVFRLNQEERRLRTAKQNTAFNWIINSIFWLIGILEILLLIRFVLRLFGANRENEFAQFINNLSAPFMAPFSTLFISPTSEGGGNIFDVNIVIAIGAYALLGYLVISLVKLIFNRRW